MNSLESDILIFSTDARSDGLYHCLHIRMDRDKRPGRSDAKIKVIDDIKSAEIHNSKNTGLLCYDLLPITSRVLHVLRALSTLPYPSIRQTTTSALPSFWFHFVIFQRM